MLEDRHRNNLKYVVILLHTDTYIVIYKGDGKMLNDKIVKDIIEFVQSKEHDSLGSAIIFAYEGKEFCVSKIVGCYDLQYEKQLKDDKINRYVNQYFYDKVDNNFIYAVLPDANEVIALLHELGHIKYVENVGVITDKEYEEVRNKVYNTYNTLEEGLRAYRNISYEKYADEFAIDFINRFGAELTHIVDNSQSVESVKEFLEME